MVITGVGMVNPLGADDATAVAAWRAGATAPTARLPEFAGTPLADLAVAVTPAPPVPGRKLAKLCSRAAALGLVAADAAVQDAGVLRRHDAGRIGIFAATGLAAAGWDAIAPMVERSLRDGRLDPALLGGPGIDACNPLLSFRLLPNMVACLVAMHLGLRGANAVFAPGEEQGAVALENAWLALEAGDCDACLAGAADQAAEPMAVLHHARGGDPGLPASAAAWLVLEREDEACARGATILARLPRLAVAEVGAGDPLAARLGRCAAAAPATLLALHAAAGIAGPLRLGGDDGWGLDALLEVCA